LYRLIFDRVNLPKGRIIISPDGEYFPFESLVTGRSNNGPVYLVEQYAVSYTYSARFLLNYFNPLPDVQQHNFMGIAPLKYSYSASLAPLTGSDHSLKKIKNYFDDGTFLVAAKATRNNFLKEFGKFRIVQLYTHASQTSLTGDPEIYFVDSSLYLSDLDWGSVPATRLVVLSACETGAGKLYQGEGVFSFNRGFAALGIPASVSNLWSVENKSTYRLTELFYKYLARNETADKALQLAKIEFLKTAGISERLPFYWASGILIGKNDWYQFSENKSAKLLPSIAGIVAGCFLLFIFFISTKRKEN
jgi:CHAT domain-containing protein